jgi:hypothetical protein
VIEDPTGASVVKAQVVVKNLGNGYELVVFSNDVGIFAAEELAVGHYTITVESSEFKTATATNLELNAGTVRRGAFQVVPGRAAGSFGGNECSHRDRCRGFPLVANCLAAQFAENLSEHVTIQDD